MASSLVSGNLQWPLVGVTASFFGAFISLKVLYVDVGEHVSSLYPKEKKTGHLSFRAKFTTS